jgi:hypothetical protein
MFVPLPVCCVRGALAHVRAIPQSAAHNKRLSQRKLPMPVLAIGGAKSFNQSVAVAARQFADDVTGAVVDYCGHWIPEEQPAWLLKQILTFCAGDLVETNSRGQVVQEMKSRYASTPSPRFSAEFSPGCRLPISSRLS